MYYGQDADLWLRMSQFTKVAFVPEVLYSYRIDQHGISPLAAIGKTIRRTGATVQTGKLENKEETHHLQQAQALTEQILEARKKKQNSKMKATKLTTSSAHCSQSNRTAVQESIFGNR